jgi:tRNA 2-thiouridine synthesizing protein A
MTDKEAGDSKLVDARGLLCPWPVLRLSRAVRELGGPGRIRIIADDPAAPRELRQLCEERGWAFSPCVEEDHAFGIVIG